MAAVAQKVPSVEPATARFRRTRSAFRDGKAAEPLAVVFEIMMGKEPTTKGGFTDWASG